MFDSIGSPTESNWKWRLILAAVVIAIGFGVVSLWRMIAMPLKSYKGALPPLTANQAEIASHLAGHVKFLSMTIGERSVHREGSLEATINYLRSNLAQAGYTTKEQAYVVGDRSVRNLEADLTGTEAAQPVVIVGAHYDSVAGTVGANDNGSGVAAVLELAHRLSGRKLRRTVRFVFFVNEEPPYFQSDEMGSLFYAWQLRREGIRVSAMISLETIGYYSDAAGSQKYPMVLNWFYPDRGNFIGFVGNRESRALVRKAIRKFREAARFPSEGIAAPADLPGVGWSDHWSFWQNGYPAIMITDTAPFRYPYYHTPFDTADKVDFERMARVVDGVGDMVTFLADEQ